jgi:hypothetical protein
MFRSPSKEVAGIEYAVPIDIVSPLSGWASAGVDSSIANAVKIDARIIS